MALKKPSQETQRHIKQSFIFFTVVSNFMFDSGLTAVHLAKTNGGVIPESSRLELNLNILTFTYIFLCSKVLHCCKMDQHSATNTAYVQVHN